MLLHYLGNSEIQFIENYKRELKQHIVREKKMNIS